MRKKAVMPGKPMTKAQPDTLKQHTTGEPTNIPGNPMPQLRVDRAVRRGGHTQKTERTRRKSMRRISKIQRKHMLGKLTGTPRRSTRRTMA